MILEERKREEEMRVHELMSRQESSSEALEQVMEQQRRMHALKRERINLSQEQKRLNVERQKRIAVTKREKTWILRYEQMVAFRRRYGHCRVPHGHAENKQLSWWVMNNRAQHQKYVAKEHSWLSEERVAMLDELNFAWSASNRKKKEKKKEEED